MGGRAVAPGEPCTRTRTRAMRCAGIRKVLLLSSFALLGVPMIAKAGADGDGPLSPFAVRTCDVYGKGFFRVSGTDGICAKVGGYVRADLAFGAWPNDRAFAGGQLDLNNQPLHTDETGIGTFMTRASGFVDARLSTSYGTARAFLNGYVDAAGGEHIGGTTDSYADAVINRAFFQFSGFTVGERQSNFDLLKRGFSYTPGWARDRTARPAPCSEPIRRISATDSRRPYRWRTTLSAETPSGPQVIRLWGSANTRDHLLSGITFPAPAFLPTSP